MTSRVSSKNNEERPKGKKVLRKERPNKKKTKTVQRNWKQRCWELNPVCLLLFHFVSVLSITNYEKQEKIEYTRKYQNEQFSQLTNSKNLVKYDAVTPARTNQSALAEIAN